jgi:DNA invertase Pin-like site-specific DNA recombinase
LAYALGVLRLVNTLIVDEDGVYDPRHPNDRLLLGMKGTMSEMELSIFRQRSLEALKQKAHRGELFLNVAIGYIKVSHDRIEKDPDRRIQEALALVFTKLPRCRQCAKFTFGCGMGESPCQLSAMDPRVVASNGSCQSTIRSAIS